jgi:protein-tyrosine phosphatase
MVKRVLFVCAGNICRSPMAEGIFRKLLRERHLEDRFIVDSAGTGGWHAGQGADRRTVRVLEKHDSSFPHVARQVRASDASFDLILVADRDNLRDLERWGEVQRKAKLLLENAEVPDPYYGDLNDFEAVYAMLEPAMNALLDGLEKT